MAGDWKFLKDATLSQVDKIAGHRGFAQAMAEVGWLHVLPEGLLVAFPDGKGQLPSNNRPQLVPKRFGQIYFVQRGEAGPIKIGFSKDTRSRISSLQTSSDEPLRILLVIEGTQEDERQLHKKFANYRLHGEWFQAHEELVAFIGLVLTHKQEGR